MAESIARKEWIESVHVVSRGVQCSLMDTHANRKAIEAINELFRLDISNHKVEQLLKEDLAGYNWIVALDEKVTGILISQFGAVKDLIIQWDVRDPHGDNVEAYRDCAFNLQHEIIKLGKKKGWLK